MAHKVHFSIPKRELGTADVEFDVHQNDGKLGTLRISRGSLVWFPTGSTIGRKIGWGKFDKLMSEYTTCIEAR
ncbi:MULTISPECIES: hypothetical protein [Microbulbifer]|uniref:hypothetical protein n=1 Tax=Microbulbifer TaxID=48073 RepID=UPI001141A486|nr:MULTISPECIES: hypothetical protein [Microbulbifer]